MCFLYSDIFLTIVQFCRALRTNATAFLSGAWFDLERIGAKLRQNGCTLSTGVELGRVLLGSGDIFPRLLWVSGYAAVAMAAAPVLFCGK